MLCWGGHPILYLMATAFWNDTKTASGLSPEVQGSWAMCSSIGLGTQRKDIHTSERASGIHRWKLAKHLPFVQLRHPSHSVTGYRLMASTLEANQNFWIPQKSLVCMDNPLQWLL